MKKDLTTGTWQDDTGCPISIILVSTSDGVRVANGRPECSVASATLALASSFPQAAMSGHVTPSFPHTLVGLGPFADQDCNIVFTKTAVTV
jgi:hypothetical protein